MSKFISCIMLSFICIFLVFFHGIMCKILWCARNFLAYVYREISSTWCKIHIWTYNSFLIYSKINTLYHGIGTRSIIYHESSDFKFRWKLTHIICRTYTMINRCIQVIEAIIGCILFQANTLFLIYLCLRQRC